MHKAINTSGHIQSLGALVFYTAIPALKVKYARPAEWHDLPKNTKAWVLTYFTKSQTFKHKNKLNNMYLCRGLFTIMEKMDLKIQEFNKIVSENELFNNQRFTIAAIAFTIFTGAITYESLRTNNVIIFPFFILILLFILYLWSRLLGNVQSVLATYLIVKYDFDWEIDYRLYCKRRHISPGKIQSYYFIILGVVWSILHLAQNSTDHFSYLYAFFTIMYVIVIIAISKYYPIREKSLKKWQQVFREKKYKSKNEILKEIEKWK